MTSCQVSSGLRASTNAATPATPGQALEVPPNELGHPGVDGLDAIAAVVAERDGGDRALARLLVDPGLGHTETIGHLLRCEKT